MQNDSDFLISDSFYKMEYQTPHHGIFGIYDIGNWDITVIKHFKKISPTELLVYLNELLKLCPWLYPKEIGLRNEGERTIFSNLQSFIEYNINAFMNVSQYKDFEWDLGVLECGLRLKYLNKEVRLINKTEARLYASFDPEKSTLQFNLGLLIDVFTSNPSRQPHVNLPEDYVCHNRDILETSLRKIEKSGVFAIRGFQSDFHSNLIGKYGFGEHS